MMTRAARSSILSVCFSVSFYISSVFVLAHDQDENLMESDHFKHYELDLEPGQGRTIRIAWDGQPLKARWILPCGLE